MQTAHAALTDVHSKRKRATELVGVHTIDTELRRHRYTQ